MAQKSAFIPITVKQPNDQRSQNDEMIIIGNPKGFKIIPFVIPV